MKNYIIILIILLIFFPKTLLSIQLKVGEEILNQASISFEDEAGNSQIITTNIVVLTIRQVYSATLDGDRSFEGIAGTNRTFFHTLHNTGNGSDTYCVSIENLPDDSGDFSGIQLIRDINNNGRVDLSDPTIASTAKAYSTNLILIADEIVHLIVSGDIPESSSLNSTYRLLLSIKAKNGSDSCQNNSVTDIGNNVDKADDTNIDQVIITNQAVLGVSKESVYQTNGEGITDDTIVYQIAITNSGNRIARDIMITDILPEYTQYQENSIQTASDFVGTAGIDDGANGTDGQIPFYDSQLGHIRGEIDILPVDGEIVFTYILTLASNAPGGSQIGNMVTVVGDLDENESTDEDAVLSNRTEHTIPRTYGIKITDTGINDASNINDGGDDDGSLNDQQYVDQISQGDIVWFTHQVTNLGNADDTFSLIISNSTFPESTVFQLYHANHSSPLLDTNSDGHIDTGPMVSGETRSIVVGAFLPSDVSMEGPSGATITAISSRNNTFEDTSQLRLGTINGHRVDIANTEFSSGMHDLQDADPVSQITTIADYNSKNGVTFDLYIANEGALIDQYQLSVWQDDSASIPPPDSWTIQFYSLSEEIITSTPPIQSEQTYHCQLHILIPSLYDPGQLSIFIKAFSSVTGVWDIKQDAINISQHIAIRMTPDNESTVSPGGAVEYIHNVQNISNMAVAVQVSVLSQSLMSHSLLLPQLFDGSTVSSFKTIQNFTVGQKIVIFDSSANQWTYIELVDDGSGNIAIPLDSQDNLQLKVRVMAPTQLAANSIDILIVEASVVGTSVSVSNTDRTSSSSSQLQITKKGLRDITCSADMTSLDHFISSHFQASPGECIVWQIVAVNTGAEPVCEVRLYDKAPAFTFIQGFPIIYYQPYPGDTGLCSVSNEELECCVGNPMDINADGVLDNFCLRSGERAEIRFRVEIE
jgi:uncharacterized repeat protein (TIGR01451 family)